MVRVLVVEDDPISQRYAEVALRQEGHQVLTATSGEEAVVAAERAQPELVLLDLGLPGIGGVEVARRLRAHPATASVPIIFLTARREEAMQVAALDAGGDDYLIKPFSAATLAARLRAVLRRSRGAAGSLPEQVAAGGVTLDAAGHHVVVRGHEVTLTPREFSLLHLLMAHAGRAVERQRIFDAVWGPDFVGDQSTLDVYVRALRRKLEREPDRPELIQTVRGVGYRFTSGREA